MKIACLSDIHGYLPDVPDCDLLLLGGDYIPSPDWQIQWLKTRFAPWLNCLSRRMKVIGVAGNHDLIFEQEPDYVPPLNWTYLQDSGCEWNGLQFYGSPYQPTYYNWAFNLDEPDLARKWALIPDDTDILLLHGPPRGYGDFSPYGNEHCGSPSLLKRIEEVQPKLAIAGHIHSGYGRYQIGNTVFLNCAYVDENYKPAHPIQVVELEGK